MIHERGGRKAAEDGGPADGAAPEAAGAGAPGEGCAGPEAFDDDRDRRLSLRLWVVLSRAHQAVSVHDRADIERHGLTTGEFGVLEALYHKGPLHLGQLREKILVSSGGITYLMDRLAEKGLARREPCPEDRRASYAVLTEEGAALIEQIFPEHAACLQRALSGLAADEKERAAALLKRLGLRAQTLSPPARASEEALDGSGREDG